MKKWFIPVGILLTLVAMAFVPVSQTYQLSINSSYFNVYRNLASAPNWYKWYPSFKGKEVKVKGDSTNNFQITDQSSTISLKTIGLGAFNVNVSRGSGAGSYNCVLAANEKLNVTDVIISHQVKLPGYLRAMVSGDSKATFIYQLKNYLEDTKAYYGFSIVKQTKADQFLIVKTSKYLSVNICQSNIATQKQLRDIAGRLKLKTSGELRLQYLSTIKDSTNLIFGLAIVAKGLVDKQVNYMQMPGGRVLVGYFKGKYKDRQELYKALYSYMADNSMHQQTKPYETFVNNQLPANDESVVDMQVIVPYV